MSIFKIGQLVTHPKFGLGIVVSHDTAHARIDRDGTKHGPVTRTGRVCVHFEPHPVLADPAALWPEELTAGPERPWQYAKAEDIPLVVCWLRGADHAAYGWTKKGIGYGSVSDAQRDAYDRGYSQGSPS